MPRFIPKIDLANTSGSIPVGATSPGSKIKIDNESNNFIQIKFGVYGTDYLPPWTIDLFPLPDNIASIDYIISGTLSSSGSPDNSLYGVYYDQAEPVHGSFPVSTNRQANIGNNIGTSVNQIIQDGLISGTHVMDVRVSGAPSLNIFLDNSGHLYIKEWYNSLVLINLLELIPGDQSAGVPSIRLGSTGRHVEVYGNLVVDGISTISVEAWNTPTLLNGWLSYDGGTQNQLHGYMKDPFGFVHLRGLVRSGTLPGTIFTLPVGYRPTLQEHFIVNTTNAAGALSIDASGNVTINTGTNTFVALNGITFKAA